LVCRKSAAWISSPGDYRDDEEENEDGELGEAFQRFGGSLYRDEVLHRNDDFYNRLCSQFLEEVYSYINPIIFSKLCI